MTETNKVFISYSSRDSRVAQSIIRLLREALRLDVFDYAEPSSRPSPGAGWREVVFPEIEKADLVIVLQTDNSLGSPFCQEEFEHIRTVSERKGTPVLSIVEPPRSDMGEAEISLSDVTRGGAEFLSDVLARMDSDANPHI